MSLLLLMYSANLASALPITPALLSLLGPLWSPLQHPGASLSPPGPSRVLHDSKLWARWPLIHSHVSFTAHKHPTSNPSFRLVHQTQRPLHFSSALWKTYWDDDLSLMTCRWQNYKYRMVFGFLPNTVQSQGFPNCWSVPVQVFRWYMCFFVFFFF